ncbi:hypothetical protein [Yoonia sp. SDW83-1]
MRAFLISLVALVVITIGSNQILNWLDFSAEQAAVSEQNVRLD